MLKYQKITWIRIHSPWQFCNPGISIERIKDLGAVDKLKSIINRHNIQLTKKKMNTTFGGYSSSFLFEGVFVNNPI
jgi:hypothetical protein